MQVSRVLQGRLQRDAKEKELSGKIVEWKLPVYEVDISNKDRKIYKIQTSSQGGVVGAFVYIHAMDNEDESIIAALKTGNTIHFKGKIKNFSFRSINIDPAVLIKNNPENQEVKPQNQVTSDVENQIINALTLTKEDIRENEAEEIIKILKNKELINDKPETRVEYADYYPIKSLVNFLGHELVLIENEYLEKYIGCCVNPGVVLYVRLTGNSDSIENFATTNKCSIEKNLNTQDLFNSIGINVKLKSGNYAILDCRERSLLNKD